MKEEGIPKNHQLICKGCGKVLDMRDPSVLSHGWIEDGKIVCYEEKEIEYSGSKEVKDSIFWTRDKVPIHLN